MDEQVYQLSVSGLPAPVWSGPTEVTIAAGEVFTQPVSVAVDPYELENSIQKITFTVRSLTGDEQVSRQSRFFSGAR